VEAPAEEPCLELLVGSQAGHIDVGIHSVADGNSAGDQAAVIPPIEANPGPLLPGLVLQVSGLVELLVVVDTEHAISALASRRDANSAQLRLEETRGHARHDNKRSKAVELRNGGAKRVAGNFGVVPFHREEDRSAAENAEVVAVVCVLPDVFGIHDQVLPERLLETRVKFIAPGRL